MKKVTEIKQIQPVKAKHKLRVAAYCRVSTDSDEQLESLENQQTHYENYIAVHDDWELAGIYLDEGITGTKKDKRPALIRLIADCENHLIDYVITKSLSRFSRNTTDCLELVRKLQALNIPILFERENLNTGSMEDELILAILSSMAEGESASTSENSKWSIQKRFRNGTFKLSYPPYGYDWNGEEMVINPEQAEIVKGIFADYLSGTGVYTIAQRLNEQNIPSRKNSKWHASTVKGILVNEKYTGDAIFQKTYTDGQFVRHVNYGEKEKVLCEEHHEAIISHEDFEAVAALISQHSREKGIVKGSDKYQARYAFSGNIICGECGGTFKRRIHSCSNSKYVAWACGRHLEDKSSCSMLFIKNDDIENAFVTMLNKLIYARKLILHPLYERLRSETTDDGMDRIKELETQLLQISEQRQTLQRLMAQGYLDQVIFTGQKNELMTKTQAVQREIETLQNTGGRNQEHITELQKLIHFTEKNSMLQEFSEDLFTEYADGIIVYSRNEIGFVLKCGLTLRERI